MDGVQVFLIGASGTLIPQIVGTNEIGEVTAANAALVPAGRLYMPIHADAGGGFAQPRLMFAAGDNITSSELYVQGAAAIGYGYNGGAVATAFDRLRTVSPDNKDTAAIPTGVQITAKPAHWTATHRPGSGTLATITQAAQANRRHVVTDISVTMVCVDATVGLFNWTLQEGATIKWGGRCVQAAVTTYEYRISGLSIAFAVNTAAVLAWGGAPSANNAQMVCMSGYTTPADT